MHRNHKSTAAQENRFAVAYADCGCVAQAALTAGYPARIAMSIGVSLLSSVAVQRNILRHIPLEADRAEFSEKWGMNISDDPEDVPLFDRIQMASERIAYEARGNLPPPSELTFAPRQLSRRAARARAARALQETM